MSLKITKDDVFPLIHAWADGKKVLWPNQEWNDSNPKPSDTEIWLEVAIENIASTQPCLGRPAGGSWERDEGEVLVILYYPLNTSKASGESVTATELAESLKKALQQRQEGNTSLGTGRVGEGGRDTDLPFWRYNIFVPFRTDNLT